MTRVSIRGSSGINQAPHIEQGKGGGKRTGTGRGLPLSRACWHCCRCRTVPCMAPLFWRRQFLCRRKSYSLAGCHVSGAYHRAGRGIPIQHACMHALSRCCCSTEPMRVGAPRGGGMGTYRGLLGLILRIPLLRPTLFTVRLRKRWVGSVSGCAGRAARSADAAADAE